MNVCLKHVLYFKYFLNFVLVLFRLYLVKYDLDNKQLLPDFNVDSGKASAAAKELKSQYFGWLPVSLSNMELMRVEYKYNYKSIFVFI